jgi:hypothetical protein
MAAARDGEVRLAMLKLSWVSLGAFTWKEAPNGPGGLQPAVGCERDVSRP